MARVSVEVPATSANVGPGYDAFGLALEMRNTFVAEPASDWDIEVSGAGADIFARDASNRVAEAMRIAFGAAGEAGRAARVRCENRITPGVGLGSSAAAVVGGLSLADALLDEPLGPERIFGLACEMEGHPDNVAAAIHGGFTLCWRDRDGAVSASAIEPAGGLAAVVVETDWRLDTVESRSLLPELVPHADAAFNAGHAALMAVGIATGAEDLIAAGLADRLHEPYRRIAIPDLEAVAELLVEAGALGAVLSGAGPAVLGLVGGPSDVAALERAVVVARQAAGSLSARPDCAGRMAPRAVPVAREGVRISLCG